MAGFMIRAVFILLSLVFFGVGCSEQEKPKGADVGYSDGYASGYNTECDIRATVIYGDWENEEYSQAFSNGEYDGKIACRSDRENNH